MSAIPIHQLHDRADSGLEIEYFNPGDKADEVETLGAHRDDHYIFFLVERGAATLMIDFHEITFARGTLYYVLPGQVHHRIRNDDASGWFIAVDASLLSQEHRQVFEQPMDLQQPVLLDTSEMQQYNGLLQLLKKKHVEEKCAPFSRPVVYALLQAFAGMVAGHFLISPDTKRDTSRKAQLAQEFKKQLGQHLRSVKSPAAYAEKLHVSESYLNEALKKVTGMPVSYWIMQEVVLEAKRLLYYSGLNVKEIAYELGYEDHAYFSRLFKQNTGMTPLAFRRIYHE